MPLSSENMSKPNVVIVIGRQYGSGGRELGRRLSGRLGVPYYDKSLLRKVASEKGLRPDLLEKADEKRPSLLRSMLSAAVGSPTWYTSGSLRNETLYQMQSDVIRSLIQEGSCVIVGRTADYIARDHRGLVSIFLHADMPDRIERIRGRECSGMNENQLRELMEKADSARADYYNYFTGREWGSAANYHLSLNTSGISMDQAEELVVTYIRSRFPDA